MSRLTNSRMGLGYKTGVSIAAMSSSAPAVPSYSGLQSVNTDGFTFQDDDATAVGWGTNQNVDANGVPQNNYDQTDVVYVKRAGYSAVEVAAEPVDTLNVMSRFRQRDGSDNLWEAVATGEVRSVFNEFVFRGDTITNSLGVSAGVTNNSDLTAPLPIACWLNAPYTRSSYNPTIYLYVDHAYARSGQSVAGARITVNDGTTSIQYSSNTMTKKLNSVSGLYVPVFAFTPDWSAFDPVLCTIDVEIYPYVGAKYQASVDGSNTTHTANFGVLRIWNDDGESPVYAYVDPTSPSGTPTVSTTPATAAADPYSTIALAASALATAGSGTVGLGVIRLVEDTHEVNSFSSVSVSDAGIVIESAPATTKANVIVRHEDINSNNLLADITHWRNLVIDKDDSTFNFRWGSNATLGSKNYQCLDSVTMTLTGAGTREDVMWDDSGIVTAIDCDGEDLGLTRQSNITEVNLIGCEGAMTVGFGSTVCAIHNMLGCDNMSASNNFVWEDSDANGTTKIGCCLAFNKISSGGGSSAIFRVTNTVGVRGYSFSGNIVESYGTHSAQSLYVNADANASPTQNVVVNQSTWKGLDGAGRWNWIYSKNTAGTVAKSGYVRNSIIQQINTKSDAFEFDVNALSGSRGNEPVFLRVGHRNLMVLETSASGDHWKPASWLGEVQPLNSTAGTSGTQNPGFQTDASHTGTDVGNGDYRPTIASMSSDLVPASDVCFPCDLAGVDWSLDGTDAKGAFVAV